MVRMHNTIKEAVERIGWTLLNWKDINTNPADNYLKIVLATKGNEWVTWLYNAEFDGMNNGHYYWEYSNALEDFEKRD
jgi:hypothetical protein